MRELAFELLDYEHGITQDAWAVLFKLLEQSGEEYQDIVNAVDGGEDRVWLPSNHGLE